LTEAGGCVSQLSSEWKLIWTYWFE